MKIKHWAGYGCVNVKNLTTKDNIKYHCMVIKVWGDHEQGLVREDKYDVMNWLVRRFNKFYDDDRWIRQVGIRVDNEIINNVNTEVAYYTIQFNNVKWW